jgi:hypothetical protein
MFYPLTHPMRQSDYCYCMALPVSEFPIDFGVDLALKSLPWSLRMNSGLLRNEGLRKRCLLAHIVDDDA